MVCVSLSVLHKSYPAEDVPVATPAKRGIDVKAFDDWISVSLDVFKGVFIIFMLTEHSRSALGLGMTSREPIMQFVSQVACSLDMTSFSTAYGFSCYRAYLTNSKNRSTREQLVRIARSVGLIICAAWFSNFHFEMTVLKNPISWSTLRDILTFDILYWDFLTTFPILLMLGFLTTKPLMKKFADWEGSSLISSLKRLLIAIILLGWPMIVSYYPLETCNTSSSRYAALFVGCIRRSFGAMRFSAFTYMFFFNVGCIVSQLLLELVGKSRKIVLPSLKSMILTPLGIGFIALLAAELYYGYNMLKMYNKPWEYLNLNGYRRFPMSAPVILAWASFSQFVWFMALVGVAMVKSEIWGVLAAKCPKWMNRVASVKISILSQFGANVLLYLLISNITIHGMFHVDWKQHLQNPKKPESPDGYTVRQWELVVLAVAAGQILLVQLVRYLVSSARK